MKTIKLLLIAAAFLLLIGTYGCRGSQHCPGFQIELADYFPYSYDEILKFANQHNDTTRLRVVDVFTTKEWNISANSECEPPQKRFSAMGQCYNLGGSINDDVMLIMWGYTADSTEKVSSLNYPRGLINTQVGASVTLESADQQISRAIVIKGRGLVEFYDKENDWLWQKID